MDKNLHDIEHLFHGALNDNEEVPSANSWENIDKRLDKESISSIKRKYKNLKRSVILLLLLLGSTAGYYLYNTGVHQNKNDVVNNNSSSPAQNNSAATSAKAGNQLPPSADADNVKTNHTQNELTQAGNEISNQQQSAEQTKLIPQNKNTAETKLQNTSEENTTVMLSQKRKYKTKVSYKISVTNATQEEIAQTAVTNKDNDNQFDIPNQPIGKINPQPIEIIKLHFEDFITTARIKQVHPFVRTTLIDNNKGIAAKNKQTMQSKFSLTPFFSPDIAWYHLKNDKHNNRDDAREIEKEEQHEFSSTVGVLVDYKLNKHWGLQSGITLSNTNISVEPKTIYAQSDNTGNVKYLINSSSGYGYVLPFYSNNPVVGDSLYAFTTTHSLQYVAIPLTATYQFTKGKFNFNALAGLSVNILTNTKIETSIENGIDNSTESINKLYGLKSLYIGGMAGLGVNYKLTNKIAITLSPVMRFALNPINKDAVVKSYPMSLGIIAGLKIGL